MTTSIDTNVIVALWDSDRALSLVAQTALDSAFADGGLVVSGPVFAELMAAPGRSENFLNTFIRDTGIVLEWNLQERVWRAAGRAFQRYAARRRAKAPAGPRRILADFLIGAHASEHGYRLLTLDDGLYRAAFPGLTLMRV
jgi:predicted nucleic acid-binding protein